MNKRARQVSYFLSSQYFSDGLRTTLSILLPALVLAQFGHLPAGLGMSLGALCVSITDAPGPTMHRRNGMTIGLLMAFVVTFITGFARMNPLTLGLEITAFSFFFSMFAIWGSRASSVGSAALLIMILMLDRPLDAWGVVRQSGLVLGGGVWYMTISLAVSRLQPYRLAQQALGQCIHEIARLMEIKADFYTVSTSLDDNYRRLLAQQVVVSEKQDAVREVLFKSRRIVTESTQTGRVLVLTFTDIVDLYEQVIAMYYDYAQIRQQFGSTGILASFADLIRRLGTELDHIGLTIQSPVNFRKPDDLTPRLTELKQRIDELGKQEGNSLVLKKVLVNLRIISQRILTLRENLTHPNPEPTQTSELEFGRFVSHQIIDLQSLRNNLTLDSSVFRHSARVAIAMMLGYFLTLLFPAGHHSYWVLLTISVIMKPAFSLTKQRNFERITGTIAGGAIGLIIILLVPDKTVQFGFMVLFMLGTYSAQRVNYIVMVICVTPFILILFNFLGAGYAGVVQERLLDTILGGSIALTASYLLFPQWESAQLMKPIQAILQANIRYLQLLLDGLTGRTINLEDYKLARKDVYVTSANLAAAFERMRSEPKRKQQDQKLVYQLVVLNHILSANVSAITSALLPDRPRVYPVFMIKRVKRALFSLTKSLSGLKASPENIIPEPQGLTTAANEINASGEDLQLLDKQLRFIRQISRDISRVIKQLD